MRKVNLTVKAKVMVPLIVTYNVIAKVDEGVPMERVAKAAISGKIPDSFDIDDSGIESMYVDGTEDLADDLDEQIRDYIDTDEGVMPKYLRHDVDDSR